MSVRKLRNAWWVDFQFDGIRYRKRSPENSKPGAEATEARMRQRLARGENILVKPVATPTLAEFSNEWLTTYVDTHDKPSVQRGHRSVFRVHLIPFFGHHRIDAIKSFDIERFQARKLKDGLSAKTVNNAVAVLMKCLRTAMDWERIVTVPRAKPLKTITPRFDFLTPAESDRLIEAAACEPHWHSMILVALETGLRLGELRALGWEDVDLERRRLTVRYSITDGIVGTPKSGKIRHVPLSEEVCMTLSRFRKESGGVWRGRGDGDHTNKVVYAALNRITKRAGLRHIGWHVLRHTFASQLASAGIPIIAIKELLGHSDINMTMRYAHLAPSTLHRAVSVFDQRRQYAHTSYGNRLSTPPSRALPAAPTDIHALPGAGQETCMVERNRMAAAPSSSPV
jgi:integrase